MDVTLFISLGVLLVSIIETPMLLINWHIVPKHALTLLMGAASVCLMVIPGRELTFNLGPAQACALGWGLWCLATCAWSHNPRCSYRTAWSQMSLALIFVLISSNRVNLTTVAIFGTIGLMINAFFATYQHWYGDPWIPAKKGVSGGQTGCGFGTLGNRNWYSAYVCGAVAFPLYLAFSQSLWWLGCFAYVLWTLKLSRCKGALLALTLGLGALVLIFSKRLRKQMYTLRYRLRYWQAGWFLFKERPFLGHGMRQFRREVYRAHATLDKRTNGAFLDPKTYPNPRPRETHNDFLGFAVDTGLVGLSLLLGVVVFALIGGSSLALTFGIVAVLFNALVFYPLRTGGAALVFWVLLGMLATGGTALTYQASPVVSVVVFLVFGLPILITTYRYVMSHFYGNMGFKTNNGRYMERALRLDPNNSTCLTALLPTLMTQDAVAASDCAKRILEHFDGDTVPWAILSSYGQTRMALGSFIEAQRIFEQGLEIMPHDGPLKRGLAQCKKVIQGGKVEINFKPQEPAKNG